MKPTRLLFALSLLLATALPALAEDNTNKFTTTNDQSFTGGKLLSKPGKGGLSDIITSQRARNRGVIAGARITFSAQPADADTITIGGHVFEFDNATPPVAGGGATHTAVYRGANAAAALQNVMDAINGVTNSATVTPGSTPFSLSIVADAPSATVLRVQVASKQGGTAVPAASGSITLACSITAGASAWPVANLNASGGKALADQDVSDGVLTITAAMVTAGVFDVELPFTPTSVLWDGYASTGIKRAVNEAVTLSGSHIHLVLAGGGSPNWQATDIFRFHTVK